MSETKTENSNPAAPAAATPPAPPPSEALQRALVRGDLSALSAEERYAYMVKVCESVGLSPVTRPFDFLTQPKTGRVVLYARKDATEQLRKLHHITLELVSQSAAEDCYVVHVRATMPGPKGHARRTDEDLGVVSLGNLRGEARANAIMAAITKAKRRVTLSICGLGLLDESELAAEPAALPAPAPPALPAPTPLAAPTPALPERPSPEQLLKIAELKKDLAVNDETWKTTLAKRNVTTARDLTPAQAAELIASMEARSVARQLQAELDAQKNGGPRLAADGFPEPAPLFAGGKKPA